MTNPIRREGDHFVIDVADETVELIDGLCGEMESLLQTDSPLLRRLFPPPYGDDTERNQGYSALAGPELIESRLAALATVREVLRSERIDEARFMVWMRCVNDMRLVLGTMLDVTDDAPPSVDDQGEQALAVYEFLGVMLELTVSALTDE